ncbi:hypothetical protein FIBSPDRAFT_795947, partial [Athelia psychrophila]
MSQKVLDTVTGHTTKQAIFHTTDTYGGHVTNVAGNYVLGVDGRQLVKRWTYVAGVIFTCIFFCIVPHFRGTPDRPDPANVGLEEKQLAIQTTLDGKLAYAKGVSWDPTLACLPGTRVTMMALIDEWSRSLDGQNVFWLNGVAGSGKSAIAHTVAQKLHKKRVLASSFFFNQDINSRDTLRSIFSKIARDIATRNPDFAEDISAVLEEDLSLASAPLARQFEELIIAPLRRHVIGDPIVVVIDALDETSPDGADNELLRILRDEASELPPQLRIIVTSRPTRELVDFLSEKDHIQSHHIDITSAENADDIEALISGKLQDNTRRDKMGLSSTDSVTISDLKMLSEGLFIWIVT